ncbi:hypothetical protein ACFXPJ_25845, partial [Streptomyces goshikiensis]
MTLADPEPDRPSTLPYLLEAVLSVGSELELNTTLQHIVDSAAELCEARYGARGGDGPPRRRLGAPPPHPRCEGGRAGRPRGR